MEQKLQHRWSILCTKSSIDAQSNNLSLFNVIEQVDISMELFANRKDGAVPINLELVTLWEKLIDGYEVQGDIEMEFQDPQGKSLGKFPYVISMQKKRHRHIVRLDGLPVTDKSGRYVFKVRKKEEKGGRFVEVGEVPVEINIAYTLPKQQGSKRAR